MLNSDEIKNICPTCKSTFLKHKVNQKYCSKKCKNSRYYKRKEAVEKICIYCKKIYYSNKEKQIYCSIECGYNDRIIKLPTSKEWELLKEYVYERDNYKCSECHNPNLNILEIHHIIPLSMNGNNNHDNLELLCKKCHVKKHWL